MATITIELIAEKSGFKGSQTYSVTEEEAARILWAYDHCYACDGDMQAIFGAITKMMISAGIDFTNTYEMTVPRDPIVPTQA